jgi:probable rRNA maturation factor
VPALISRRARGSPSVDRRQVRVMANRMLAALELGDAELSILLTDDAAMRVLNREHRGKDRPTDVLAFPLGRRRAPSEAPTLLGDVVISIDTAARQAQGRRRDVLDEIRFLLAHGLLHLLGFDHATPAQKRRMDAQTRRLVRAVHHDGAARVGRGKRKGRMDRRDKSPGLRPARSRLR